MNRICFFNVNAYSFFNPSSKASIGGTEMQLYLLSNYLSKTDSFDVSFITGDWGQKETETFGKIKVCKSTSLDKGLINYIKAPFVIWRKLKEADADLYIASSAGPEIGIVSLFCFLNKKKFIYRTAHDIDCSGEFARNKGFTGMFFKWGMHRADQIVVQSIRHREMLKNTAGPSSVVIQNAFSIENKSQPIKKENYILWVARCSQWKRPDLFLDIVRKFKKQNFIMICPQQENESYLYDGIFKKSLSLDNLKFIESVPFDKVQKYFDKAYLFVNTSEYEGFPNVYLQACMGGTPIISYKVNPDDYINKNNIGYCADGNFEIMLEQIQEIFLDEKDWKEKSENTYVYVKENHDINKIGEQWKDLIYKLLKK